MKEPRPRGRPSRVDPKNENLASRRRVSLAVCVGLFVVGAALTWYGVFMWAGALAKCPPGRVCDLPTVAVLAMGIAAAPLGGAILAWYPCRLHKRYRQQEDVVRDGSD